MKARHLTGLTKYAHLARAAITADLLKLPLRFGWFLVGQMRYEKPTILGNRLFVNTSLAPLKSRSYKTALKCFSNDAQGRPQPLSVHVSVTNRCVFNCLYCSNTGSADRDLDGALLCKLITQIQNRGAACIGITGGEPLLRNDLEQIISNIDGRSYSLLFTSGHLLDRKRATTLKKAGLTAIVVSLDSHKEKEHNSRRNSPIAFDTAVSAIQHACAAELYTAVSMVITKEMLYSTELLDFLSFVGECGAHEVRILRPMPCGKLMGGNFERFEEADLQRLVDLQYEINKNRELPTVMALPHIGSIKNYGCSAGRAHAYVSGDGDVYPCDFVPLSFGNIVDESFGDIYDKMSVSFEKPGYGCISQMIFQDIQKDAGGRLPVQNIKTIQHLLQSVAARPTPRLYKKLGYD